MGTMVTPKKNRNGTYYIRKAVPKELQYIAGKTALKRSLNTKILSEANQKAPSVINEFNAIIENAKRKHDAESLLSDAVIMSAGDLWLDHSLKNSRDHWAKHLTQTSDGFVGDTNELSALIDAIEQKTDDRVIEKLAALIEPETELALAMKELEISSESQYWPLLVETVARAKMKLIETCFSHFQGSQRFTRFNELIKALPEYEVPNYLVEESKQEQNSVNLTVNQLCEQYRSALHRRDPKAAEQRIRSYSAAHQRAIEFFGDKAITKLVKRDFVDFRNILEQLPKQPKSEVKKLTLAEQVEIAKKNSLTIISANSVRVQLTAVSALFEFAVDEALIASNPVHGVGKNITRQSIQADNYYTDDEIHKIFDSQIYTANHKPKRADYGLAHYWIPLILYYTGARVEEIAQLYVENVLFDQDVPHFKLTSERDDQSIKTGDTRLIPIHEHLLELGFKEYVADLTIDGRLFPKLALDSQGKYSYQVAAWLSGFIKKALCIEREQLKPMHGFRHGFITKCRELGIREDTQNAITGHRQQSMGAQYGAISLEVMQTAINAIPKCQ